MAPVGYSGTPLAKKLGVKPGAKVVVVGAPQTYLQSLKPLPAGVTFEKMVSESINLREVALPMGLVDVKVCAVDEVWSGLKLVIRKELR